MTASSLVGNCLKLGFGLMRLPRIDGSASMYGPIDLPQTIQMVDAFLAAGGRYFDTAFVYPGSEEATRAALVDRHPRDAFFLATKLNAAPFAAKSAAEAKAETKVSLDKTGARYFDFYLLHAISQNNLAQYDGYGCWDHLRRLKDDGLARHIGFSFHDVPDVLERVLDAHPETEFVQLQINYADWDDPSIQSRRCYEVAAERGIPVVVMEPAKGGLLANPPPSVRAVLEAAAPGMSPAAWAIRYAASLPGVMMVLSGMSTLAQMADNLSFMRDFRPLDDDGHRVIAAARAALAAADDIPCTACHYCTPGCPKGIHIPELFALMNQYSRFGDLARAREDYGWRAGGARASACIQCHRCEQACPQHLPIVQLLEKTAATLEA
ncbi:MAG: aldo/keto reductase [Kiritimatiellae bacterium]|nr:aldo/keto reductase [Kiritimatiellia bacterium]